MNFSGFKGPIIDYSAFFVDKERLKQLKVLYLYAHADGALSAKEVHFINQFISNEEYLSREIVQQYREYCADVEAEFPPGTVNEVLFRIREVLGKREDNNREIVIPTYRAMFLEYNKPMQAQTIWTMINLGYSDGKYSEGEKKIVDYLVSRWEMDPLLVNELIDSADAIQAITMQKQSLLSGNNDHAVARIKDLDNDFQVIANNIYIAITEAAV